MAFWVEPIRHAFSKVPLFGPLVYCKWAQHQATLREMLVICVFATATFWLTAVFLMGHEVARSQGYFYLLKSTVEGGELFIFTVGFIGPILLNAGDDPKDAKNFPSRLWAIFALILLGLVATGFHSQIKAAQFKGSIGQGNLDFFFEMSLWVACGVVILRYLSIVYRKSTFVPQVEIKDPELNFADRYEKHVADESPE